MDKQSKKRYEAIKRLTDSCDIHIKDISFIPGGRTNEAFIVWDESKKYIARIAGEGTGNIINRQQEIHNLKEAARIGIAPIFYSAIDGDLLIEFVEGISRKDPMLLTQPDTLDKITTQLCKLHRSDAQFIGDFSFLENYHVYKRDFLAISDDIPEELHRVEEGIVELIDMTEKKYGGTKGPVHGDTALQNFIIGNQRAYMIDWEYSNAGDAYQDLANLSILNALSPEIEKLLLNSYESKMDEQFDQGKYQLYKMSISFMWVYWHLGRLARNVQVDYNSTTWRRMLDCSIEAMNGWKKLNGLN